MQLEQLSCHSGYTLTVFRTSCLWDLGKFSENKVGAGVRGDNNGVDVIRKRSSGSRVGASARREEGTLQGSLLRLRRELCHFILADSKAPGTRCRHGRGHEERLRETLILLQIPGQVPTAASAEPVPQSHQAVGQKG